MERKVGLYWHVHHDRLVEWCHGYDERVDWIRDTKSEDGLELRLRLFQPVTGHLPPEVVEAGDRLQSIWQTRKTADDWGIFWSAVDDLDKVLAAHQDIIEALHQAQCPECPWSGRTIFKNEEA